MATAFRSIWREERLNSQVLYERGMTIESLQKKNVELEKENETWKYTRATYEAEAKTARYTIHNLSEAMKRMSWGLRINVD